MTVHLRRTALLGLLLLALRTDAAQGVAQRRPNAIGSVLAGMRLSAEAARELELRVKAAPNDTDARTQLLGYYSRVMWTSAAARTARDQHILWLIRNQPEAPVLATSYAQIQPQMDGSAYAEGKNAWLEQVKRHPRNPAILGNAGAFFLLPDRALAEGFYKRAEAADTKNRIWPDRLGHLYSLGLQSKTGADRTKAAKMALAAYERSLRLTDQGQTRAALLPYVATTALEAGEVPKARGYAEELLKNAGSAGHWNYGNAVHYGHLVLGRIALRSGNLVQAKQELLAAGKTPGSPTLNSFGPNMRLAKELLEKGERQTVLEYFRLCGSFWKNSKLDAWSREVRAGGIPDFGANLSY